jgi:EAL domain-containing protein (putative c-di-GMP-specific phosphodiesterase class I)
MVDSAGHGTGRSGLRAAPSAVTGRLQILDAGLARSGDETPLDAAVGLRDADILAMVRRALDRRDVILAFQPVVDARDPTRIAFYEGLLRVLDDTGRIIPAREFIGACETHEVGRLLDVVALDAGLNALAAAPSLRLSINMSARSIGYLRWAETFNRHMAGDPSLAERLIIEITERSAILLPEVVSAFMSDLQMRGVAFALDDFGAGFTSFRYLRDFDFDILKIAGEFAQKVAETPDNRVLFEALVSIARHFDMFTVAEGVERAEDAAVLSAIGVDCMQGYAFAAPSIRVPCTETEGPRRSGGFRP